MKRAFALSTSLILLMGVEVAAKSWRGIVPLRSTRADVQRVLGPPITGGGTIDLYELEEGHVNVMYAGARCEQGLPADWGNWNVPAGRVVNISISLHVPQPVAKLKIRNLIRYKWYTDNSGATYYHDKSRGIEYQVQGDVVTAITYGPSAKDSRLLCKRGLPRLKY